MVSGRTGQSAVPPEFGHRPAHTSFTRNGGSRRSFRRSLGTGARGRLPRRPHEGLHQPPSLCALGRRVLLPVTAFNLFSICNFGKKVKEGNKKSRRSLRRDFLFLLLCPDAYTRRKPDHSLGSSFFSGAAAGAAGAAGLGAAGLMTGTLPSITISLRGHFWAHRPQPTHLS